MISTVHCETVQCGKERAHPCHKKWRPSIRLVSQYGVLYAREWTGFFAPDLRACGVKGLGGKGQGLSLRPGLWWNNRKGEGGDEPREWIHKEAKIHRKASGFFPRFFSPKTSPMDFVPKILDFYFCSSQTPDKSLRLLVRWIFLIRILKSRGRSEFSSRFCLFGYISL